MNATSRRMLEQREKKKQAIVQGELIDLEKKPEVEEQAPKEKVQPAKLGFGSTAKRNITHQKSPSQPSEGQSKIKRMGSPDAMQQVNQP